MTAPDSAAPQTLPATLPRGADLERLRNGLRITALRALGDADAADEAVQETLFRAVTALADHRLADPAKLVPYVAGIARHVCSQMLRDRKKTISLDDSETDAIAPGDARLAIDADPLEALISAAETDRLRVAFGALSPADQRLLRLCFHEDQTPAEVASTLKEPADRVRKRKSRALDRLRRAFLGETAGHDERSNGTTKQPRIEMDRRSGRTDHD